MSEKPKPCGKVHHPDAVCDTCCKIALAVSNAITQKRLAIKTTAMKWAEFHAGRANGKSLEFNKGAASVMKAFADAI